MTCNHGSVTLQKWQLLLPQKASKIRKAKPYIYDTWPTYSKTVCPLCYQVFKMSLIPIKSEKSERDQLVNHVFYPVCVQGRLRQALQSSGAEVFVLGIEPSQQGVKELNMESGGERNP